MNKPCPFCIFRESGERPLLAKKEDEMIILKITNNTERGIALPWVRGGISIPAGSAAILDYDPFTLMDRNSNVYRGALDAVLKGVVTLEYGVKPPARIAEATETKREVETTKPVERKPFKNKSFEEKEPPRKNESPMTVAENAPLEKPSAQAKFDITIPAGEIPDRAEHAESTASPSGDTAPSETTGTEVASVNVAEAPSQAEQGSQAKPGKKKGGSKKL